MVNSFVNTSLLINWTSLSLWLCQCCWQFTWQQLLIFANVNMDGYKQMSWGIFFLALSKTRFSIIKKCEQAYKQHYPTLRPREWMKLDCLPRTNEPTRRHKTGKQVIPIPRVSCTLKSGWPDWAIFCQSGHFWRLSMIFWKDEVAQNNGYFCLSKLITFLLK